MALQIRRGLDSDLPPAPDGELLFATDTEKLYIGNNGGHILVGPTAGGGGGGSGTVDSASTITLITNTVDSAYVQGRVDFEGTVDSAYIQARQSQTSSAFDSAASIALTIETVDSAYVQALQSEQLDYVTTVGYNPADPSDTASIVLDARDILSTATYMGNVIDDSSNVIVDAENAIFSGTLYGTAAGNITTPTGSHTVISVGTDGTDGSLNIANITATGTVDLSGATVIGSGLDSAGVISAVTSSDLDMGGNKVLFSNVYSTEGDLPSATDNHGMFAHVHGTAAGYFAHAGNWVRLANSSDVTAAPVSSVNTKTGAVVLDAADVGALPSSTSYVASVNSSSGAVVLDHTDVGADPAGTAYTKAESDAKYALAGAGGLPAGGYTYTGTITATDFVATSDERLKDNITPMPTGLIDNIEPVTWEWKDGSGVSAGVVAQQLQSAGLGEYVHENEDGQLGVNYQALTAILLAEVIALKKAIK